MTAYGTFWFIACWVFFGTFLRYIAIFLFEGEQLSQEWLYSYESESNKALKGPQKPWFCLITNSWPHTWTVNLSETNNCCVLHMANILYSLDLITVHTVAYGGHHGCQPSINITSVKPHSCSSKNPHTLSPLSPQSCSTICSSKGETTEIFQFNWRGNKDLCLLPGHPFSLINFLPLVLYHL